MGKDHGHLIELSLLPSSVTSQGSDAGFDEQKATLSNDCKESVMAQFIASVIGKRKHDCVNEFQVIELAEFPPQSVRRVPKIEASASRSSQRRKIFPFDTNHLISDLAFAESHSDQHTNVSRFNEGSRTLGYHVASCMNEKCRRNGTVRRVERNDINVRTVIVPVGGTCQDGGVWDMQNVSALAEAFQFNTKATTLDVEPSKRSWNEWLQMEVSRSKSLHSMARMLETNFTLSRLVLAGFGRCVGAGTATILAASLGRNRALAELRLHGNAVGDRGAAAIADALAGNRALRRLDLANNGIGAEGAGRLAAALRTNATLTHLNLDGNDIGNVGGAALAAALEENEALAALRLRRNDIGLRGGAALSAAMATNCTLSCLSLEENPLSALTSTYMRSTQGHCGRSARQSADILRQIQIYAEWNKDGPFKGAARRRYYGGLIGLASFRFETFRLPDAAEQDLTTLRAFAVRP